MNLCFKPSKIALAIPYLPSTTRQVGSHAFYFEPLLKHRPCRDPKVDTTLRQLNDTSDLNERANILARAAGLGRVMVHYDSKVQLAGVSGRNSVFYGPKFQYRSYPERDAIMAHEIGHLKQDDSWLEIYPSIVMKAGVAMGVFGLATAGLGIVVNDFTFFAQIGGLSSLLGLLSIETVSLLQRRSEYLADEIAARLIGVETCLADHYHRLTNNLHYYRAQSWFGKLRLDLSTLCNLSHPTDLSRIRHLEKLRYAGEVPG